MDGLMIDSEPYWDKARSMMAAEVGIDWNAEDQKAVMLAPKHVFALKTQVMEYLQGKMPA